MQNSTTVKWEEKNLEDVAIVGAGNSAPQDKAMFENGIYPFFRTADVGKIHFGIIDKSTDLLNDIGKKGLKLFSKGTILFPKSGASTFLNHRVMMNTNGFVVSHLATIKANENILSDKYLLYYLSTIDSKELVQDQNYPSLNLPIISAIKIKIPPLPEQERIVKILDEAFENIDKAKQNAQQNLNNAKELFESYAHDLLFNISNTKITTIGQECSLMTGGTPNTKNEAYFKNGNIKWLVSGDIHKEIIYDCEGRITELGLEQSNAKYLPENSVLIALNGQGKTRGTVALLKTKATCNQSLVSIMPNNISKLSSEYLYQNLKARYIEIRKMTGDGGNDRRGLNMPLIRSIKINIPNSLEEQNIIANKIKHLQEQTKELEAIYEQKIKDLDELKQSILQKAFNGEL